MMTSRFLELNREDAKEEIERSDNPRGFTGLVTFLLMLCIPK